MIVYGNTKISSGNLVLSYLLNNVNNAVFEQKKIDQKSHPDNENFLVTEELSEYVVTKEKEVVHI